MNRRTAEDEQQAGVSHVVQIDTPRFVGRAAELTRVVRALVASSALVLVEGEAGIGKSRLVRETLAALRTHTAAADDLSAAPTTEPLVAVCPPFREPLTLGPIVDAARQRRSDVSGLGLSALAGTLRPLFPEWGDALPPPPEPLSDPGAARHRLIRALAELLDRLGVSVLVVEDVHWADEATMDFLLFLATRPTQRISLLLTYRAEDLPADSLLPRLSASARQVADSSGGHGNVRVTLGGLEPPEVAQLVSSMLDDELVSPAFAELLHSRTEGVPLALEESVRLLHARSDLVRRDGEWIRRTLDEIDVPPSIRDAVTDRVGRLSAEAQQMLLAAAVLVDAEAEPVLAHVSGLAPPEIGPALREAVLSGLIGEDEAGRIAFRHVLAARAVYHRAAGPDRRAAHRRAAATLEDKRPVPVARLAYHYRAANEMTQWGRYAEQAADLALAAGDHPTAVSLLHELLTEGGLPASDVARIAQKFPLLSVTGYLRRADVVSTLRSVLDDERIQQGDRGRIREQLGRILIHVGEHADGVEQLQRAIPDLADSPSEVARAMATLGGPVGSLWPAAEHRRWIDRAASVAESRLPEAERLVLMIDQITALLDLGEPSGWDLAAAFPAQEATSQGALNLARLSLNTADGAMQWGHYQDARRRLAIAGDVSHRHHYLRLRDMTLVTIAHLDWFTGAWSGLAERARHWVQLDDEPVMQLDSRLVLGLLGAAAGDDPTAEDAVRSVRDESTRRGIADMSMESTGALARLRLAAGDVQEALSLTDDAIEAVLGKEMWLWATETVPVRVAALIAAEHLSEAEEVVAAFARGFADRAIPSTRAALETCRALLAQGRDEHADAAAAWEVAAAAWQALPRPYYALLAREQKSFCLVKAGEGEAALSQWTEVAQGLAVLGAKKDAERVADTLQQHGGEKPGRRRAGRRGYGNHLSPREQEVVELLLSGLTNREIAIALSRSPKTIAAQLNSAMRKHGVTTRTALAVIVTQSRFGAMADTARD
ncbi:helix-turn-helix transcriptional regulator [Catenulispora pinisilvae]|uniref:helix-turn-helix transcriptional regulator n=1 Tax=Catenulispora pinisilvae TaxID=2705253 RepID=UPI0018922937|nr:AAA family ATPase [Catenulispora pinisilvae]